MTYRELGQRMDSREFAQWLAWDSIQPIGWRRLDILFANYCALLVKVLTGRNIQPARFDLFEDSRRHGAPRSMEAQKREAVAITRLLGGTVRGYDDR